MRPRSFLKSVVNPILQVANFKLIDINEHGTYISKELFKELSLFEGVIFDVGANTGYIAADLLSTFPDADLHLFEANPLIADELHKKFENQKKVKVNKVGLGEREAKLQLSVDPNNSLVSSFMFDHGKSEITCDLITLDSYIVDNNISRIGLLKLDVEGFEEAVIKGGSEALRRGVIDALILEATFTPKIIKSSNFQKINDLLNEYGYKMQGFYDPDYSHIYSKGVFKLSNVLFLKASHEIF